MTIHKPNTWIWVPSAVTLIGFLLGAYGIVIGVSDGWWALALSLLCDLVDGEIARKLNAVTRYGADLDWHTDVLLTHALLFKVMGVAAIALIVPILLFQAHTRSSDIRVSLRSPVWIVILFAEFF